MLAKHKVDYLKFVFKIDHRMFQEDIQPTFNNLVDYVQTYLPGEAIPTVQVLQGRNSKESLYIIEAWGWTAHHMTDMVPMSWWLRLRRFDVREEEAELTEDDIKKLGAVYTLASGGRLTVSTFSTRPQKKTNQRDVGGSGIRFGSRKSGKHLVAYKRGKEAAAVEFRLQDVDAEKLGKAVYEKMDFEGAASARAEAVQYALGQRVDFLAKHLGFTGTKGFVAQARLSATNLPASIDIPDAAELREAANWWESLSSEEQEEIQKSSYTLTDAGWGRKP